VQEVDVRGASGHLHRLHQIIAPGIKPHHQQGMCSFPLPGADHDGQESQDQEGLFGCQASVKDCHKHKEAAVVDIKEADEGGGGQG